MKTWAGVLIIAIFVLPAVAFDRVTGSWELTLQLLPTTKIYYSELDLTFTVAGWEVESESKFYSTGFRYQNFYIDGELGDWDVWGKIYFSAEETRYQKSWLDFQLALPGADNYLQLSVNHWASEDDYWSSDEDMFGPWPCGVVSWDEAHNHYQETLHVQGPVDSVYVSGSGSVTIHLGLPYPDPNRFDIYIPSSYVDDFRAVFGSDFPDNLVGKTVCIYGYIKTYNGIYEIETHDPGDLSIGPCCGVPNAFGPLMIWRAELALAPLTLTADFADCCTGIHFQRLTASLSGLSLCCGLSYDASLVFSKCRGFESLTFTLGDIYLGCCDITGEIQVEFTSDGKSISFTPSWPGISSCIDLWGDIHWDNAAHVIDRLEIYGVGITCYFGDVTFTAVGALNPDAVEDLTDYTFYSGEFEYLAWEWEGAGCCGGTMSFSAEFWFGEDGLLFGIQRTKYVLTVPLTSGISFTAKGQWDFSDPTPLDWFDVSVSVEF